LIGLQALSQDLRFVSHVVLRSYPLARLVTKVLITILYPFSIRDPKKT
jgi:hypothetical protein